MQAGDTECGTYKVSGAGPAMCLCQKALKAYFVCGALTGPVEGVRV